MTELVYMGHMSCIYYIYIYIYIDRTSVYVCRECILYVVGGHIVCTALLAMMIPIWVGTMEQI